VFKSCPEVPLSQFTFPPSSVSPPFDSFCRRTPSPSAARRSTSVRVNVSPVCPRSPFFCFFSILSRITRHAEEPPQDKCDRWSLDLGHIPVFPVIFSLRTLDGNTSLLFFLFFQMGIYSTRTDNSKFNSCFFDCFEDPWLFFYPIFYVYDQSGKAPDMFVLVIAYLDQQVFAVRPPPLTTNLPTPLRIPRRRPVSFF